MKVLAIISEYNPFHTGHLYHIMSSRKLSGATHVVAVMSGSAVQRGSFSFVDKWTRAQTALLSGVDLVVELPYAYAAQSAEYFAGGAVKVLNATNSVDVLSFGSEGGELPALRQIAELLAKEPPAFQAVLRQRVDEGTSFPIAREEAVGAILGPEYQALIKKPNNILAVEYLKALLRTNASITPLTVKRAGAGYNSVDNQGCEHVSATYLRKLHAESGDLAKAATYLPYDPRILTGQLAKMIDHPDEAIFKAYINKVLTTPLEELRRFSYMEAGLEFRLQKSAAQCTNLGEVVDYLSGKRLPRSRIRRLILNLLLGFYDEDLRDFNAPDFEPYLRVLGFNEKGQELLKEIKNQSEMPVITNTNTNITRLSPMQRHCIDYDCLATDLFSLYQDKEFHYGQDFTKNPVIIDKT